MTMSLDILEIQDQQRQAIVQQETIKYCLEGLEDVRLGYAEGEITYEEMIMKFNDYLDLLKKYY
jgi:hypothetical protein